MLWPGRAWRESPGDFTVRAEIAKEIVKIGEESSSLELKLEGHWHCFYSSPTTRSLLFLYQAAWESGNFMEYSSRAVARVEELESKGATGSCYDRDEHARSRAEEGVFFNSLLLQGDYKEAFALCKEEEPLGWSSRNNSKPVFVAFMLRMLAQGKPHAALDRFWREVAGRTIFYGTDAEIDLYQELLDRVAPDLTASEEEFYLAWCLSEVGKRVNGIVSNKYRGSYDKAAQLLVAMAETLSCRGQAGLALIEEYKRKYHRYSAFRREVDRAILGTMFDSKVSKQDR